MEIECKQNHFAIETTKNTESRGKLLDNISSSYVGFMVISKYCMI